MSDNDEKPVKSKQKNAEATRSRTFFLWIAASIFAMICIIIALLPIVLFLGADLIGANLIICNVTIIFTLLFIFYISASGQQHSMKHYTGIDFKGWAWQSLLVVLPLIVLYISLYPQAYAPAYEQGFLKVHVSRIKIKQIMFVSSFVTSAILSVVQWRILHRHIGHRIMMYVYLIYNPVLISVWLYKELFIQGGQYAMSYDNFLLLIPHPFIQWLLMWLTLRKVKRMNQIVIVDA